MKRYTTDQIFRHKPFFSRNRKSELFTYKQMMMRKFAKWQRRKSAWPGVTILTETYWLRNFLAETFGADFHSTKR